MTMPGILKLGLLVALVLLGGDYAAATMKAVVQSGPHTALAISTEVEIPVPGPSEVRIRILYTAVNRMDLVQAKGLYVVPPGASPILGVEVSGVVDSIGPECELGFDIGDQVMALLDGGGYAEYATCDERTVMRVLPGIDMVVSSAIPEAFMTAYQLLFLVAKMEPGESVLIHAAASSVGQAAIQMAVNKGITVLVTSRSADKIDTCLRLGAHFGYVATPGSNISDFVSRSTFGKGVDVILDPVGSAYLRDNLDSISHDGRWVLYGLLSGGVISDEMNNNSPAGFMRKLLFKRVTLLSTTLRARSYDYKASLIKRLAEDNEAGFGGVVQNKIKVHVDRVYDLKDVQEAHQLMATNKNVGKIVMSVGPQGNSEL